MEEICSRMSRICSPGTPFQLGSPKGKKPKVLQLEATPVTYKKVLEPKEHPSHKKKAEDSSEEENAGKEPNYDGMGYVLWWFYNTKAFYILLENSYNFNEAC
jgi:hypothetical protein